MKSEIKEITAREGYYLTQAAEVGDERIFIVSIKGAEILETDWREATKEEKIAFAESKKLA